MHNFNSYSGEWGTNCSVCIFIGFFSNGEYVFRAKGYTCPISVLTLRSLARNKYTKMSVSKMEQMIFPKGGCYSLRVVLTP